MKKDVTLYLQTSGGSYRIADVQYKGWEIIETFVWPKEKTENVLIEWLERLIKEGKIDIADAIRVGIYYAR